MKVDQIATGASRQVENALEVTESASGMVRIQHARTSMPTAQHMA
jgi:hypothetical protein